MTVIFNIERIEMHPLYRKNQMSNDIALIKLDRPVSFTQHIKPVCLPKSPLSSAHLKCTIVGWGLLADTISADILQEGIVPLLPNQTCERTSYIDEQNQIDFTFNAQLMICTSQIIGKEPITCVGDSGGPLLCRDVTARNWVVEGIVSFGSADACTPRAEHMRLESVFARVSTFVAWINSSTSGQKTRKMSLKMPHKSHKRPQVVTKTFD